MGSTKKEPKAGRAAGKPKLSKSAQDRIGRELQAFYQELVDEPLPDKLKALLDSLGADEQPETKRQSDKKASRE